MEGPVPFRIKTGHAQTRPLPHPNDFVAPASPGASPKTEEPTGRYPPGRYAGVDAAPMADVVARWLKVLAKEP